MHAAHAGSRRPLERRGSPCGLTVWLVAALVPAAPAVGDAIDGIAARLPKVAHMVHGSPEPPPPFRAGRVLPEVQPAWPVAVAAIPGSDRLVVIEQREPYGPAWISCTLANAAGVEKRLDMPREGVAYSVAFDPDFAATGWIYVGWNAADDDGVKRSRITRWRMHPLPPHAIDPASALELIVWDSNGHNGAAVAFAPDGMLFVSTGDGTSDSDTLVAGQRLDHLLAKVLRIDVRQADAARPYVVPADNPFVDDPRARPETWAYGLRNPWRMTCDDAGRLWVGNNGQDLWEQVYLVERGANYGWSVFEGSHPFQPERARGPTPIMPPLLEHHHAEARSLTGGIVAGDGVVDELRGAYLYGDYSTGKIWAARVDVAGRLLEHREIADTPLQITSFAQDAAGTLVIADHRGPGEGGLYTLVPRDAATAPTPFPRRLSETGLFADLTQHRPVEGAIPYGVNSPLWSDDAHKERFVVWPATVGSGRPPTIDVDVGDRGWNLPEGTVTVKSFALEMPTATGPRHRWVETRVMLKEQGEWAGYSYRWNDEQTDAVLVDRAGAEADFAVATATGTRRQTWRFPSRTECMVCHSRAANFVLGLCTPQLNRSFDYGGMTMNQLAAWERLGLVRLPPVDPEAAARAPGEEPDRRRPEDLPRLVDPADETADRTARVKAYLHANCAHCHVEAGGGNARLQVSWSTPLEAMRLVDEPPLHGGFGLDDPRIVAAGAPERSVLLHRLGHRGTGQMPQLATSLVDRAAVELITAWITEMAAARVAEETAGQPAAAGRVTIAPETTRFTEPLRPDGDVDFLAAVNRHFGRGVSAEDNACVLLYEALGPSPEGQRQPDEFFRLMGVEPLPDDGAYFQPLQAWIAAGFPEGAVDAQVVERMHDTARSRPWTSEEFPLIAAWLDANAVPLQAVIAATGRPRYHSPLVAPENNPDASLVEVLLPGVQATRGLARALVARAMRELAAGHEDEAWRDLLAVHRLGRLVGHGPTLIEFLVGVSIESLAIDGTLRFVAAVEPSSAAVAAYRDQLDGLPPRRPMIEAIAVTERAMGLDIATRLARGRMTFATLATTLGDDQDRAAVEPLSDEAVVRRIDWDGVLTALNGWYDRITAIGRETDVVGRRPAEAAFDVDLRRVAASVRERMAALTPGHDGPAVTAAVSDMLVSRLLPSVPAALAAETRGDARTRSLEAALALAAWRADHDGYPDTLEPLVPAYLAAVPHDPFAAAPLRYEVTPDGYRLWSVGNNGADDKGRSGDDDPPADDLVVRMPAAAVP